MQAFIAQKAGSIRRLRSRPFNTKMDLMKLFGIFCVVHAHVFFRGFSISGKLTVSSVYVIQLFIFCSGYFYHRDKDQADFSVYLKKCAKSYLVPYFLWNLIYGFTCQILRCAGIISYGADLGFASFFLRPWTDAEQYIFNTPSWFLLSLFLVAMVTWGLRRLLSVGKPVSKRTDYILLLILFAIGFAAVAILEKGYNKGMLLAILRPAVLLPYYQLGIVYKNYWEGDDLRRKLLAGLILLVVQFILPIINGEPLKTSMIYGQFSGNPLLLIIATTTAILLICIICDLIAPLFEKFRVIPFFSRYIMYVMLHHLFILFLIQILLLGLNCFVPLNGFDPSGIRDTIWYEYSFGIDGIRYMYLLVALIVPSVCHWCYEWFILKLADRYAVKSDASKHN